MDQNPPNTVAGVSGAVSALRETIDRLQAEITRDEEELPTASWAKRTTLRRDISDKMTMRLKAYKQLIDVLFAAGMEAIERDKIASAIKIEEIRKTSAIEIENERRKTIEMREAAAIVIENERRKTIEMREASAIVIENERRKTIKMTIAIEKEKQATLKLAHDVKNIGKGAEYAEKFWNGRGSLSWGIWNELPAVEPGCVVLLDRIKDAILNGNGEKPCLDVCPKSTSDP